MNRADNIGTVMRLLHTTDLLVPLIEVDAQAVSCQMQKAVKRPHVADQDEEVCQIVIWIDSLGEVPQSFH